MSGAQRGTLDPVAWIKAFSQSRNFDTKKKYIRYLLFGPFLLLSRNYLKHFQNILVEFGKIKRTKYKNLFWFNRSSKFFSFIKTI